MRRIGKRNWLFEGWWKINGDRADDDRWGTCRQTSADHVVFALSHTWRQDHHAIGDGATLRHRDGFSGIHMA